jgi:tetratricopeptide (TPR) repeat protein
MKTHRMPSLVLASILLAVTLAPEVSATTFSKGDFTAASAQANGPTNLQAPLVAFLQLNRAGVDLRSGPAFTLAAQSLRVQTYYFDPTLHPASSNRIALQPQASSDSYRQALVQGIANRDNYRFGLFSTNGQPKIEIVSTCSNLAPSPVSQDSLASKVTYQSPDNVITFSAANALRWADCSDSASIKITGDFVLMLWEWDAAIRANGQDYPLPSGQSSSTYDPTGSSDSTSTVSYDRQRYLYVENGTLTIPTLTGSNYAIYVGPEAHLHADAGLAFKDAIGELTAESQTVSLQGNALQVKGSLDLDASGTDTNKPFTTHLSGTMQNVVIDGRDVGLSSTVAGSKGLPSWTWILGAVGAVVAVPVLATPLMRRAISTRRAHRIEELTERGMALVARLRFQEAKPLTLKLLDLDPQSPDAHYAHATVLGRLGDCEAALQYHQSALRLLQMRGKMDLDLLSENAFQAGSCAAFLHAQAIPSNLQASREAVLRWLRQALEAKPALQDVVKEHAEFRPFLSEWGGLDGMSPKAIPGAKP